MLLKNKTYHQFEIAICGLSGSGKSTLIQKLLSLYQTHYSVFYAKHDAHHFEMDHPGKDTYQAIKHGSKGISIFNEQQWASIHNGQFNIIDQKLTAINYDFVLAEGHKFTKMPKIVFTNKSHDLSEDILSGKITDILAIIGDREIAHKLNVPYFDRDEDQKISTFVLNYFQSIYQSWPLNGVVLVGGRSSRMGFDKAKIVYHQVAQAEHVGNLLSKHCKNVFYSGRADQTSDTELQKFPFIADTFFNLGPSSGILSYFQKYPNSRLLISACDMPFIDEKSIEQIIKEENPFKTSVCFKNPEKNWPEPLFAIYNPKTYSRLLQLIACGYDCPMKMLFNSDIHSINLENEAAIKNINTSDEYQELKGKKL